MHMKLIMTARTLTHSLSLSCPPTTLRAQGCESGQPLSLALGCSRAPRILRWTWLVLAEIVHRRSSAAKDISIYVYI